MPATVTASLDAPSYPPGATMTLTVRYTIPTESRVSVRGVVAFLGGSESSPTAEVPIKLVTAAETGRTWTLVSDDGATAVFRATAS